MPTTDMEILRRAYEREGDSRDQRPPNLRSWTSFHVGAGRAGINRLVFESLIEVTNHSGRIGPGDYSMSRYRLTEKGKALVHSTMEEQKSEKVPAAVILEAMELVMGYQDLKEAIAFAIESQRRAHFLLEGPPACGKSVLMEGVRSAVPDAYIAFGSRTSASGLSDVLFEYRPSVLLLDEADKIHHDVYAVLLGLMESGEVLETKSKKTRGINLKTMVIAACNSSAKMPPEFLSRFALHPHFPQYTRDEFIEVCRGFLSKLESCPPELAQLIGQMVYDANLGDVRKSRAAWKLMTAPTEDEAQRVINLMLKYSQENVNQGRRKTQVTNRMMGL